MRDWKRIHIDAGLEVFFCDPHSPWQRGTNENTERAAPSVRPQGASTSPPSPRPIWDAVADELNERPRKRFGFAIPTEQL